MPGSDILESALASIEQTSGKDQLQKIITAAQSRLAGIVRQERKEVARQIQALAASAGLEVEIRETSAAGRKPKRRKYPPTTRPPKYRNPADPAETWHGRGPRPDWMRELVEAGHGQEEFLIDS